ncbi:hypothetical protein E2C01_075165 [Portunus trituberculatus]|uniref:MADF domain-containing protein n=1 Tax=Portunus trituberculatus TaxID=210409 RepID=A0A5B7IA11_PORTR|nr:hypothetical protein [Portunus trituberculatus]
MAEKKKESERKMMSEIIDVYRSLPALWKIKSNEYSEREKKADAYKILYGKYKKHYPNATLQEMKKKINTLRTNFRAELRKVERSEKCAATVVLSCHALPSRPGHYSTSYAHLLLFFRFGVS